MSNYSKADTRTQWFQDNYPGSDLRLSESTAVVVLHTTETMDWPGYSSGKTAPNYTHKPSLVGGEGHWRAHFPDEKSSRALRNEAGGVQTNTLNCVQVELIGTCDYSKRYTWTVNGRTYRAGKDYVYWPAATDPQLKGLARFLAYMHNRHGLRLRAPKPFIAYGPDSRVPGRLPASYGAHPHRMTFEEWRNATGVVGHQHVPENSHGDPGSLAIKRILELADHFANPPAPEPTVPLRYSVHPNTKPTGKEYHGPGHPRNAEGLSRYHEGPNSLRGLRKGAKLGFPWADVDVMVSADGVLFCNHSFGAMWKEGFRAKGLQLKNLDHLDWEDISRLRAPDGIRIQKLYTQMVEARKLGVGLAIDLKGDGREGWEVTRHVGRIVRMANQTGCRIYFKCDPKKAPLRKALHRARELGCWVRYNGLWKFWGPL